MQRIQIYPPGGPIDLEVDLIGAGERLLVFLHEGLGSLAGWGDWPRILCEAARCRGLVFSRYGYGHSQARPPHKDWSTDYLGIEARENLPALLKALGIDAEREPPILFGHSDGATIALQYAAAFPRAVAAIVVLAPHLFVEQVARDRIGQMRQAWPDGRVRALLARQHDDPEGVFMGWSGSWTAPQFADWNIAAALETIGCPTLAVQGRQDQFGTLEQLEELQRRVPHAELLVLDGCRHIPHEERPDEVRAAVVDFLSRTLRTLA
jgi:pimeloyl-ACP methyl ester carboxylesterase